MANESPGWEVLSRETLLYRPPWVRVEAQTLRLEDGETIIDDFYAIDLPNYVVIFAITADHRIPLIEHYRHPMRSRVYELPAGIIDAGETPLAAAIRELREETGMESADWQSLGMCWQDPNRGCGQGHYFLARDAQTVTTPNPGDLQQQTLHILPVDEVRRRWQSGKFPTLSTVAALGLGFANLSPDVHF